MAEDHKKTDEDCKNNCEDREKILRQLEVASRNKSALMLMMQQSDETHRLAMQERSVSSRRKDDQIEMLTGELKLMKVQMKAFLDSQAVSKPTADQAQSVAENTTAGALVPAGAYQRFCQRSFAAKFLQRRKDSMS